MKSVFLSAGHSEVDPGVVVGRRREADIAVEARNMVGFYLAQANVVFETDGTGTANLPLKQAAARARRHPIGLEFHCNGSTNRLATGCEVLSAPDDVRLSADVSRAISTSLNIRDRGAKPENAGQHHRLAFVQAGGIIVEMFFLTNPLDLAQYDERKWLMAKSIADVIIKACRS
jgi:N-acetylmuramoyl-L-alanine amidase